MTARDSGIWRRWLLFLFSHRLLAIARWDLHFLGLRVRNAATLQPYRMRRLLAHRSRPLYLNLGAGPRGLNDRRWINVDGFRDRHVHLLLDFTRHLPFPDESFDGVFCEHVLEHFSLDEGEKLAREVRRILRRGGCFRVIVPDAELLIRRYLDVPTDVVARRGVSGIETPMEIVNLYFRQRYEHQFLYDTPTLERTLRQAGFTDVVPASFQCARLCPSIVLDDAKYEWESLYLEAVR